MPRSSAPSWDPHYSQWCPPELTAAARPLRASGQLLKELSDDSAGIERFAETSPSTAVRAAMAEFVERWRLVVWEIGGTANSLGHELDRAAADYVGSEADLSRRLQLSYTDHFGRRG